MFYGKALILHFLFSPKEEKMSKTGIVNTLNRDLDPPSVRITQYSYLTMEKSWDNPNRNAPFWRFYWNRTPGAQILFRDRVIELAPDQVILIAPHINYASRSVRQFTQLYMHFEWEMEYPPTEPLVFSAAPMMKLLSGAEDWFGKGQEKFVVRMHAVLLYYLAELMALDRRSPHSRIDPRIEQAINLMDRDLTLNNRAVAWKINMSCDNFQRIFRSQIGMTPCQYRLSRRMEYAQQLLQNTSLSLTEVALRVGFSNPYQFSKAFKQFFKLPPGASRKKHG